MFHQIPDKFLARMKDLEALDARDRADGTPRLDRLRQVPPQTGRFISLLAATAPPGQVLEIGTSAGYSSLWLALACRSRGDRLITMEILDIKVEIARQTIALTDASDVITLIHGDALQQVPEIPQVAFCFLDAEKEIYQECYDLVVPRLVPGGLLLADNVISHASELETFVAGGQSDPRLDAVVVPIGQGILLCRKG